MADAAAQKTIKLADLYLDAGNPRVPEDSTDQRVMMRAIAQEQGAKLVQLAKSVVELGGVDPSALPIVMERGDVRGGHWVLEGNRRVLALKLLDHPALGDGILEAAHLKSIKKLANDFAKLGLDSIPCVVFPNRESARPWIKLRHTGENRGAGTVPWNAEQAARWDAGDGPAPAHIQAIDYVRAHGTKKAKEQADGASVTNVKRLLDDPHVRGQLGLEQTKGQLFSGLPKKELLKALALIVQVAADHKVKDIYTAKQRRAVIGGIPSSDRPDLKKVAGLRSVDSSTMSDAKSKKRRKNRRKSRRERKKLIPHDCVLYITDERCNELYDELGSLDVDRYPNAVAALFRVFLELTVDHVIATEKLPAASHPTLKNKMQKVEDFLEKQGRMTKAQLKSVRTIRGHKKHFLGVSIDALHDWIHSPHWSPSPGDLRTGWDNMQVFFEAIWVETP